jgi:hypothetical protein
MSIGPDSIGTARAIQRGGGGHQHAALAITALRHLLGDPCLLHRMQLLSGTQGFNGGDFLMGYSGGGYDARADRLAIHMDCAGTTGGYATAEFGAG